MAPAISILMPLHNEETYLPSCIDSIVAQQFKDWELIVIDDHSTDGTRTLVENYQRNDSRIKIFSNREQGLIPALRTGLEKCSGQYITRMDGDDLMPSDRLNLMVRALKDRGSGTIVTGLVSYFSDQGEVSKGMKRYESWLNQVNMESRQWENIYRECVIASPNWMCSKDDLLQVGGYDDLRYPEDYHLVHLWYQHSFQVECIPQVTLLWREHASRTSRHSTNYTQDAFFDLKIRQFLKYEDVGDNLILWGTGVKGKMTARILDGCGRDFTWMAQTGGDNLVGHDIHSYEHLDRYLPGQLLIAVYPEKSARLKIRKFLADQKVTEGKNYWYL